MTPQRPNIKTGTRDVARLKRAEVANLRRGRTDSILRKLEGGDRRSIGRSNEVVADVLADPALLREVFSGLVSEDVVVRIRAADAVEKITAIHPEYLDSVRALLIGPVARLDQKEVRWHAAQMLPRVEWTDAERQQVLEILFEYLNDPSSIVKTFAMQALADLARQTRALRPKVLNHLRELTTIGTSAMKARGRKLLSEFGEPISLPTKRIR